MPEGRVPDAWMSTLVDHWRGRQEWILQQQMALTRIAAPTGAEAARAMYLATRFRELPDLNVRCDRHGNVCAHVAGAADTGATHAAPLICLAHLDTVFSEDTPLVMRREEQVIHCPGIGDNGRGLAALLTLAHLFDATSVRRRLTRPVQLWPQSVRKGWAICVVCVAGWTTMPPRPTSHRTP